MGCEIKYDEEHRLRVCSLPRSVIESRLTKLQERLTEWQKYVLEHNIPLSKEETDDFNDALEILIDMQLRSSKVLNSKQYEKYINFEGFSRADMVSANEMWRKYKLPIKQEPEQIESLQELKNKLNKWKFNKSIKWVYG